MTELYQLEEEEEEKLKNKHPSVAPSVPSAPLEKVTTLLITGSKTREREREKMNSRKEEKKKVLTLIKFNRRADKHSNLEIPTGCTHAHCA